MDALLVKDDAQRSQAPEQDELPDSATDSVLGDLVRLAAQICETPVAMVCLIEGDSYLLRAAIGVETDRISRASLPVAEDAMCVVRDTRIEPEFAPDGVQLEGLPYCFYATAALTMDDARAGMLAVMDQHPRQLTEIQTSALGTLARQAAMQLEMAEHVHQMEMAAGSQRRAESALTVEGNFVSAVLDTIGALVVVFDTEGRIVRFNRACETVSGYGFAALAGSFAWERLIPELEIPEAIAAFERLREGEFPSTFENRWLNRDGSVRHITWAATALRDTDGEVAFLIATGTDVTAQRAADLTLRESEARYRQLVEGSLGMVFTHDTSGTLLSLNAHGAATMGRTVEEMVGHPLMEFIPAKRRPATREYLRVIENAGEAQGLLHLAHSDGEVRVIAYRNKLITVPERTPYVLGVGIDITEQVRAERKLKTLTRQSDSILESVGDGIFCIDLEGRVTVANTAAAQMLGYSQDEMLGEAIHPLIHHTRADGTTYPVEESPVRRSLSNFGTARVRDEIFWRKDGTCFPVEYIARPLLDTQMNDSAEIRAIGVVVAFTDTTERRALERMKDEFISTVSHELRTPLTSLKGALGLLTGGALEARPEKSQQMLEIAINNTERLVRLVNDILDLERISSGKNELRAGVVRADELLREAVGLERAQTPGSSTHIFFAADEVSVWADSDRVLQVLHNLLSNAVKFSAPDGEIHLTARDLDGHVALFEVRDYGSGISEDKLENIFDRFRQGDASDSRALGGTGLGLAICRSIVDQHGGRIWATSSPGRGTTVHFTLPIRPRTNLR
jgi:PAS domain S-box-containing protein